MGLPVSGQGPEHDVGPDLHVGLGVGHDDRFAGRSARSVQPHHVAHRAGEQAERIGVAEVRLAREREPGDVVDAANVRGRKAPLVHAAAVQGHAGVGPFDDLLEPQLGRRQEVGLAGGVIVGRNVLRAAAMHMDPYSGSELVGNGRRS
jgi:hypothetical protein